MINNLLSIDHCDFIAGEDGLGGAGLGGAGFEFGVDPNEDPELALVIFGLVNVKTKHI